MNLERITLNPDVMGGKPCIRGMRVTVATIVGLLAAGRSFEEILDAYPYLETEDIRQALSYAACRSQEIDFPLPAVYNRELDEALERINSGEYLTQEEVE